MNNVDDDYRPRLYAEFKQSVLQSGANGVYYDESDLLEIFDYAGDQGDDATRTEVIAVASHLYPQSDDLLVRKAFYYLQIDSPEMCKAMVDGRHGDNVLWEILELTLNPPTPPATVDEALNSLFSRYPTFDDEAVIQIINLANRYDRLNWAVDHIADFKAHTTYMPTCYYEIAILAGVNHDTGTVIKMCEELTRLEPFTDIYWTMLAQAYAEESQVEKALSAVDYALAINEKNKEAILLKAQLRLLNDDADDGLMAQMNELLAANPNDYNVLKTAAVLYQIADREDDLALLYTNFLNDEPGNWQVLESLLEIFPFRMYIERYYDSAPTHDENEWLAMAERLGHAGHHESASELLGVFNDREVLSIRGFEAYVVEMYMAKKYKEIIDKLEKPVVKVYDPYVTAVVSICYAYSLLRTSHEAKALKFIDEWFVRAENHLVPSPQMRLTETGVSTYFQELDSVVRNPTAKRTFDSIDPFRPMIPGSPAY